VALTHTIPPLKKGCRGILNLPLPLFTKEGEFPRPLGERDRVRGRTPRLLTQTPLYERGISLYPLGRE